jgi:predicted AAA+ superfamily ATPase
VGIPVGIISYLILSIVCGDENYKELKSIVKGRLHKETDNVE